MTDSISLDEVMSRIQSFREADTDDLEELSELLGLDLLKDYAGADLREVDLSYKKLEGADFSYSDLQGANLSHSNLRGANLEGANLSKANLTHADLTDADLSSANLTEAILTNTLGVEQDSNQEISEDTNWDIDFDIDFNTNFSDVKIVTRKPLEQAGTSPESLPIGISFLPRRIFGEIIVTSVELVEIIKEKVFSQSYFLNISARVWNVFSDSLRRISQAFSTGDDDSLSILGRERLLTGKILSFDRESKVIQFQIQSERDEDGLNQIFATMKEGNNFVILDACQGGVDNTVAEILLSGLHQEILDKGSFEITFIGGNRLGRSRSRRRSFKSQPLIRGQRIISSQVKEDRQIAKNNEEVTPSQNRE